MEVRNKTLKALIITGKGVQDHEFIYPYYRLLEAGFKVTVALEKPEFKQPIGFYGTNIPPDENCAVIRYTELLKEEYSKNFDLLVLPGGAKCMEYLRQNKTVIDFIHYWNKQGKMIAVICHGAQLLISAKAVRGKKIAAYYSLEDDVVNAGAEYCSTYCISQNIYSASHYKHLGEWMKSVIDFFFTF